MATKKQLEALAKGREVLKQKQAKNKKVVCKALTEAKKKVKKTTSKIFSKARKKAVKETNKVIATTKKRLQKKGLAGEDIKSYIANEGLGRVAAYLVAVNKSFYFDGFEIQFDATDRFYKSMINDDASLKRYVQEK